MSCKECKCPDSLSRILNVNDCNECRAYVSKRLERVTKGGTSANNHIGKTTKRIGKMNPIRPEEIVSKKKEFLPDAVIEVFNLLIAKHWNGKSSRFKQDEAVELIAKKLDCKSSFLFENHYLDVEDVYREMGWKVAYDKPSYNETYPATFYFSV